MSKETPNPSHKNWKCGRCGASYQSPIPVTAVRCGGCANIKPTTAAWMKPDLAES